MSYDRSPLECDLPPYELGSRKNIREIGNTFQEEHHIQFRGACSNKSVWPSNSNRVKQRNTW